MRHRQSSSVAGSALAAAAAGVMLFGPLAYLLKPPALAATAPQLPLSASQSRHCPNCGWIEAKRELVPLLQDPQALRVYEYTLRMPDGSMHVFQETLPTSWRLGEGVILIESDGTLD